MVSTVSKYREQDLRAVRRSQVRFGWAVPLKEFIHGRDQKERQAYRKRFVHHIFESEDFKITACNWVYYVELVKPPQGRSVWHDATPKQLYSLGLTKTYLRDAGLDIPVGKHW